MPMDINIGDVVELKKQHACGCKEFEITRVGMDIKIKCTKCLRSIMLDRETGEVIKTFDLKDVLNIEDGKSENWIEYDWFHNNSVWYDEETNSITLSGRHQDAVINIDYDSGDLNLIIGDSTNWSE